LQAQIFSGKKVLALAMNFGTFYIFSAVRQLGSFYSALSLAPNVGYNKVEKNDTVGKDFFRATFLTIFLCISTVICKPIADK